MNLASKALLSLFLSLSVGGRGETGNSADHSVLPGRIGFPPSEAPVGPPMLSPISGQSPCLSELALGSLSLSRALFSPLRWCLSFLSLSPVALTELLQF